MAQVTVATGYDVDYYLDQVGADYYLTAAGEPPGIWAGKGAEALGLRGKVGGRGGKASAETMRALFHYGIGPDGVPLGTRQRAPKYQARAAYAQVEEAIAKRIAALGGFATPEEKREIRLQERARMRTQHALLRHDVQRREVGVADVRRAARRGEAGAGRAARSGRGAARSGGRAGRSGGDGRRGPDAGGAEQRGAIVRTGHHSASSGEFRDAEGLRGGEVPAAHQPGR